MSFPSNLTPEEEAEQKRLDAAIDGALAARKKFLDEMMVKHSKLKVGDSIFNLNTGHCLGEVIELYRYWRDRNPLLDISYWCDYRYRNEYGDTDNTSRQTGLSIGTKEDVISWTKYKLGTLEHK